MIVGPTGGGKTVVLDTLKAARLKAEGVVVKYYVINPKAQPLNELYGVMDPVTRDWTDGVLSRLFRELNEPLPKAKEGKEMRWIIYDGDVDAVWVENMNSVMDDNRRDAASVRYAVAAPSIEVVSINDEDGWSLFHV